jgi:hypothetical protein
MQIELGVSLTVVYADTIRQRLINEQNCHREMVGGLYGLYADPRAKTA